MSRSKCRRRRQKLGNFLNPGVTPSIGTNQLASKDGARSPFISGFASIKLAAVAELIGAVWTSALGEFRDIDFSCIVRITQAFRRWIVFIKLRRLLSVGSFLQ